MITAVACKHSLTDYTFVLGFMSSADGGKSSVSELQCQFHGMSPVVYTQRMKVIHTLGGTFPVTEKVIYTFLYYYVIHNRSYIYQKMKFRYGTFAQYTTTTVKFLPSGSQHENDCVLDHTCI